jgi:hypothetical protein
MQAKHVSLVDRRAVGEKLRTNNSRQQMLPRLIKARDYDWLGPSYALSDYKHGSNRTCTVHIATLRTDVLIDT